MDDDGFKLVSHKKIHKKHTRLKINQVDKCLPIRVCCFSKDDIICKSNKLREEILNTSFWQTVKEIIKKCEQIPTCTASESSSHIRTLDSILNKGLDDNDDDLMLVCFGIGEFADNLISTYQMALLMALRDHLQVSKCFLYDPVFCEEEQKAIYEMKMQVLSENNEGKHRVSMPTLFYMPHCGKPLYNNLLWANWSDVKLMQLAIIGNSFSSIVERTPRRLLEKEALYILQIEPYVKEEKLPNIFHNKEVFNDTALMTFPVENLSKVPNEMWDHNPEPDYSEENVEIILNTERKVKE